MKRIHPFAPKEAFLLIRPLEPQIERFFCEGGIVRKFLKKCCGLLWEENRPFVD
jgi:hypothetical protein